jgi:hypothetical protein
MTQSHSAEKTADRCAGELLWNVSLLPVARRAPPAASLADVIELPLDRAIQEALSRRNAA